MRFDVGARVEVMKPEHGFQNSYYAASIVRVLRGRVEVRYEELKDKDSEEIPLQQVVLNEFVRPFPPDLYAEEKPGDIVNVWARGGWWKGLLLSCNFDRVDGRRCLVYLGYLEGQKQFRYKRLGVRFHQDCERGPYSYKWTYLKM